MATIGLYFDTRRAGQTDLLPLNFVVRSAGTSAMIPTGYKLRPDQWKDGKIVKHPNSRAIMLELASKLGELAEFSRKACAYSQLPAGEIRRQFLELTGVDLRRGLSGSAREMFKQFIELKEKASTKDSFAYTLSLLEQYTGDAGHLGMDDITVQWLSRFEQWLLAPPVSSGRRPVKRNTCAIHLENLRAVVNYAIGEGQASTYAFGKFKIRREASVKRSLHLEDMQQLWGWECATETEQWYLDIFKISFGLCGMNIKDLYELRDRDVVDGRVEVNRSKTGVHLSIRIEPEIEALIQKHKGKKGHLINIADKYLYSHRDFLSRMNRGLRRIGETQEEHIGCVRRIISREPLWPELSTYWARHTWATIAASLDVPIETIAMGLGHMHGSATTNIYIRPDLRKLDEANRKVMNAVIGEPEQPCCTWGYGWGDVEYVYG